MVDMPGAVGVGGGGGGRCVVVELAQAQACWPPGGVWGNWSLTKPGSGGWLLCNNCDDQKVWCKGKRGPI